MRKVKKANKRFFVLPAFVLREPIKPLISLQSKNKPDYKDIHEGCMPRTNRLTLLSISSLYVDARGNVYILPRNYAMHATIHHLDSNIQRKQLVRIGSFQ